MQSIEDRDYQEEFEKDIYTAWDSGLRNVVGALPTGGGKTHVFTKILSNTGGPCAAIAHRKELVTQISLALCRHRTHHRIIAPESTIKQVVGQQVKKTGECYYSSTASVGVVAVDTLPHRANQFETWLNQCSRVVIDEGHHVLKSNKWGRAFNFFPNANGLLVTATPTRADGKGLGREYSGIADGLVVGPTMRDLINQRYLTDYTIFCPPSDVNYEGVTLDSTGDLNRKQLSAAVEKSHIVGDIVEHYLRHARGKRGITFCVDVAHAKRTADAFNAAGVPAVAVDADTPDAQRIKAGEDFEAGRILQLVNCDLFGEGYDVPAVEVVSFGRKTESYGLYVQQFGRALRTFPGKEKATIIDHVGNVIRHGLPDAPRRWSLAPSTVKTRRQLDENTQQNCIGCTQPYDRYKTECPYCGLPSASGAGGGGGCGSVHEVDGDLQELSPGALASMRGEVLKASTPPPNYGGIVGRSLVKNYRRREECQEALKNSMAWWCAYLQRDRAINDREAQKLFYMYFGVDVLSAQALNVPDTEALCTKINKKIGEWWGEKYG